MHFKNRSGFTLIEVVIAVAIIGIATIPIYTIQSTLLSRVSRYTTQFIATLYAKAFLNESQLSLQAGKELEKEKRIPGPAMKLTFERGAVASGSSIKKFKNIVADRVIIEWQEGKNKRKEQMLTFTFKQKEQAKEGSA